MFIQVDEQELVRVFYWSAGGANDTKPQHLPNLCQTKTFEQSSYKNTAVRDQLSQASSDYKRVV